MARSPEADAWRALGVAGAQLGAGPAACEAVPEGDARITCLQMAQARAVQLEDPAAVRRVCAAMVEGPWAQSCLLDALDVDPTLSLAAYTAACQSEVPLYVSHCLTHARDRFEGQPPGADPAIFATFYGAVLRRAAQPRERCEELRAEGRQACRDAWAR